MSSRLVPAAVLSLMSIAAGCGDGDVGSGAGGTTTTPAPDTTSSTAGRPGAGMVACESPEGFTIAAPEDWSSNDGSVVPACSQFHPAPFEVPRGTDARLAAVTAYIDPVPFSRASRPRVATDGDRAITTVDGRQAVRLSYATSGEGLYPGGTPVTSYLVDVGRGDGAERTLFVDTVGLPGFDYETNVAVLDRMATTLRVTDPAVTTAPDVIATHRGGGGGFDVTAETAGDEVCLRIPPGGEPVCTEAPGSDRVHTVRLQDLQRGVPAGVTGSDVWRVDLVTVDGDEHSYLPAPVPGSDAGAYAFAATVGGPRRITLHGIDGGVLRTVEPGEA